jgi:hypothetical protein
MGLIDRGHTKKKVVHRIDHNLLNQVEIGETRELCVTGCMVFHKVLACSGCGEFAVFFAKLTLLIVGSRAEHCKE